MPETYTKEQIEKAIKLLTVSAGMKSGCWVGNDPIPETVILSALSTAERERKELAEKYYAIRQADLAERNIQYDRAEKAEAQVAELEARLHDVAERAVDWYTADIPGLRTAILGEKKED